MTTTATRRAALSCALLASTAFCGLTAAPAHAQAAAAPSIHKNIDDNGVDLTDGSFNFSLLEGSIGNGRGALALIRHLGAGGERDNITVGFRRTVQGGTAVIDIVFGNTREEFRGNATAASFTSAQGSGATLTKVSPSEYRLTAADGTITLFAPPVDATPAVDGVYCRLTRESLCDLLAQHTTAPDGLVTTYQWDSGENCALVSGENYSCAQFARLRGLSNSLGHSVGFTFVQEQNPATGLPGTDWKRRATAVLGSQTVTYGYAGSITTVTDPGGRVWRLTRDGDGRVIGIRRPTGNPSTPDDITIGYAAGTGSRVVAQVTADGVATSYARIVSGTTAQMQRTNTIDGQTITTTVISDLAKGRPTSVTDPLGHATSFEYDSNGRLIRTVAPQLNAVELDYDSRGNVKKTRVIAKPGSGVPDIVTEATFPATCVIAAKCNNPETTTDARGRVTHYEYDDTHGGVKTITLPAVAVAGAGTVSPQTRFSYTNVSGVALPSGTSQCRTGASCAGGADEVRTTLGYSAQGYVTSSSAGSGDGAVTAAAAMTYDALGNLLTVDGPLTGAADTTRIRYNASREQVGAIGPDPDGAGPLKPRAGRTTIDGRGRVEKVEAGTVPQFLVTDPAQADAAWAAFSPLQSVETGYDAHSRPVTSRLVAGGTTYALGQTGYDVLGRVKCTAQRMNPVEFASPPADACTPGTPGAAGGPTDFGPDRIGRLHHDKLGRVERIELAFGTPDVADEVRTTYTANGQVETVKDGEGNLTTYVHDGHDRLKQTRYPVKAKGAGVSAPTTGADADYEEITYELPAGGTRSSGLVTSVRNRAGETTAFSHDDLGRVTLKDLPGTEPDVSYGYDLLGQVLSAAQPGHALGFTYDALGRQLGETGPRGTVASQFDLAGRRTRLTWPDGFFAQYDRLVTGEPIRVREKVGTTDERLIATLGYDDLGRRISLTRGNGTGTTYGYDAVSRLQSIGHDLVGTADDVTLSFSYDPASQIAVNTRSNDAYAWTFHGSGSTATTTNGLNENSAVGPATVTHDAKGNLLADGRDRLFAYTSENLLVRETTPSTGAYTDFRYDPLRRITGIVPSAGASQGLLMDGHTLIGEYDGSGNLVVKHHHVPDTDETLAFVTWAGGRTWFHADERGSVVAGTDPAGVLRGINPYDEYGRPHPLGNYWRFQYAGQPALTSHLRYHRARIYDHHSGRFLQPDPIGYGDGPNMYPYGDGDPVNFVDPSGMRRACAGADACVYGTRPRREPQAGRAATGGGIASGPAGGNNGETNDADSVEEEIVVTGKRLRTRVGARSRYRFGPSLPPLPRPNCHVPMTCAAAGAPPPKPEPKPQDWCTNAPDKVGGVDVSGPCYAHDQCYVSTTARAQCDQKLFRDIRYECERQGRDSATCFVLAGVYYGFVDRFGWIYYSPSK